MTTPEATLRRERNRPSTLLIAGGRGADGPAAGGISAAAMTAHAAADLALGALGKAVRLNPSRSELREQIPGVAALARRTEALITSAFTVPAPITGTALAELALDVAWAGADVAEVGGSLFASSIRDLRPDAATVCQLARAAVASAAVAIAHHCHDRGLEPRVLEVAGCLARARAAEHRVMNPYRYLEIEAAS